MWLIYHKCRRLPVNTGELECMAWDVMRKCFYIDLSYYKERQSFVIPFIADVRSRLNIKYLLQLTFFTLPFVFRFPYLNLEAATENYSLKQMFLKTKQNPLKVAGYKPVTFVKLNSSQVVFKGLQL